MAKNTCKAAAMISQDGMDITRRFFEAINVLRERKEIRGLGTFTNRYNINRWNLATVRDNPQVSMLKPEYIAYLVEGYNVSAEWLLLGKGKMFKSEQAFKLVPVD